MNDKVELYTRSWWQGKVKSFSTAKTRKIKNGRGEKNDLPPLTFLFCSTPKSSYVLLQHGVLIFELHLCITRPPATQAKLNTFTIFETEFVYNDVRNDERGYVRKVSNRSPQSGIDGLSLQSLLVYINQLFSEFTQFVQWSKYSVSDKNNHTLNICIVLYCIVLYCIYPAFVSQLLEYAILLI